MSCLRKKAFSCSPRIGIRDSKLEAESCQVTPASSERGKMSSQGRGSRQNASPPSSHPSTASHTSRRQPRRQGEKLGGGGGAGGRGRVTVKLRKRHWIFFPLLLLSLPSTAQAKQRGRKRKERQLVPPPCLPPGALRARPGCSAGGDKMTVKLDLRWKF